MADLFGHDKAQVSIERIKGMEEAALRMDPGGFFVAFSGGKDSIVLLDLVRRAGVKHEAHYHRTTVDPPELIYFMRKHYPEVVFDAPEYTMWQLIVKKRSPPTRLARFCCEYLKEGRGDGRMVAIGIRWGESRYRKLRHMVEACHKAKANKVFFSPIIDWTTDEIWAYIHERGLAYPSLYDEGMERLGCIGCPMGGRPAMLRQFERWPRYKKAYLAAFGKMLAKRRELGLASKDGWTSAQGVFDWWIGEAPSSCEPCPLFEGKHSEEDADEQP